MDNLRQLLFDEETADIHFVVGSEKVCYGAHKAILSKASNVFKTMFYGSLAERQSHIELPDFNPSAFRNFLRFVYLEEIEIDGENVMELLYIIQKYQVKKLLNEIKKFFVREINVNNCLILWSQSRFFNEPELVSICIDFIDTNASDVLLLESSLKLPIEELKEILSRDTFCATETDLFHFLLRWIEANPNTDYEQLLSCVRFSLFNTTEILTIIRPTGLVSDGLLFKALRERKLESNKLCYRRSIHLDQRAFRSHLDVNFADAQYNPCLLSGSINGDCNLFVQCSLSDYVERHRYVYHQCSSTLKRSEGIKILLDNVTKINLIKLLLWNSINYEFSYKYYIEASIDGEKWQRVCSESDKFVTSWQTHRFTPLYVKYIHVVGTQNLAGNVFCLCNFQCMFVA